MKVLRELLEEDFERNFSQEMHNFRGTEQEITVMKTIASKWFLLGQVSIINRTSHVAMENVKMLNNLRDELLTGESR